MNQGALQPQSPHEAPVHGVCS